MKLSSLFLALPFVVTILSSPVQKRSESAKNCDHPDCYLYAAELAAGVDWSVAPCDDFYKFACGRWIKHVDNPNGLPSLNEISIQQEQLSNRIKELLASYISPEEEALRKAQQLYISCIQQELYINDNLYTIKNIIQEAGGWPLATGNLIDANFIPNLLSFFLSIKELTVPFKMNVHSYPTNNTIQLVYVFQPSAEKLLSSEFPSLTKENIVTIAEVLFGVKNRNSAIRDAENIFKIDSILKSFIDENTDYGAPTLDQLQAILKYDFYGILNRVFRGIKRFSPTEQIITESQNYLIKFFNFVKMPGNARALGNYMILQYIVQVLRMIGDTLPSPLRNISAIRPIRIDSKQDQCLPYVTKYYDLAVALKYGQVYHHIDEELKLIKDMTSEIMDAFHDRLEKLDWLDDKSRTAAITKLSNLRSYYEYPSWVADLKKVNAYYNDTKSNGIFLYNWIQSVQHARRIQLKGIVVPIENLKWLSSPLSVNAFYAPSENHIHILEAILESPIFNMNRIKLMNYAGLGYILGHEITHGFDNNGVQYDAIGNYNPWLSPATQKEFDSRTQCLIDQYSNYKITKEELPGSKDGFQVDGKKTLGENVADDGGLKLAYDAYKKWRGEVQDISLPEFLRTNFTEEQVFFLSFARTWCMMYEQNVEYSLKEDEHSPDKFRIIGPLSNFPKFREAFNCPADSPMVRGDKSCHIW